MLARVSTLLVEGQRNSWDDHYGNGTPYWSSDRRCEYRERLATTRRQVHYESRTRPCDKRAPDSSPLPRRLVAREVLSNERQERIAAHGFMSSHDTKVRDIVVNRWNCAALQPTGSPRKGTNPRHRPTAALSVKSIVRPQKALRERLGMRYIEPGRLCGGMGVDARIRPARASTNIVAAEHLTKQHSGIRWSAGSIPCRLQRSRDPVGDLHVLVGGETVEQRLNVLDCAHIILRSGQDRPERLLRSQSHQPPFPVGRELLAQAPRTPALVRQLTPNRSQPEHEVRQGDRRSTI